MCQKFLLRYVMCLLSLLKERKEEFLNVASFECRRKLRVISPHFWMLLLHKNAALLLPDSEDELFPAGSGCQAVIALALAVRGVTLHTVVVVLLDSQR